MKLAWEIGQARPERDVTSVPVDIVAPPYEGYSVQPFGRIKDVPVGTVLCFRAVGAGLAMSAVHAAIRAWPWCLPCLPATFRVSVLSEVLPFFPELAVRVGYLKEPTRTGVMEAVSARPGPGPTDIARYVAERTDSADLGDFLLSF